MGPVHNLEDRAVANCLENITSLYRRSSATLSTLKSACNARRVAPPPSQLDDAIDSAVIDIEKETKKSARRFAERFENGDVGTVNALQEVERELRTGLFVKVRFATFSENEDLHGQELVDTAEWARDQTLCILHQLKQRLWQNCDECPPSQRKASVASHYSRRSVDTSLQRKLTKDLSYGTASGPDDDDTASGAEDARRKRNSSLLGFLKNHHHRQHSKESGIPGDQTPRQTDQEYRRTSQAPGLQTSPVHTPLHPPQPDASRSTSISTGSSSGNPSNKHGGAYAEWREQLSKIEQSPTTYDRHDSSATVRAPSPQPNRPRHVSAAPAWTGNKAGMSSSGSVALPTPTPENNYLGFCKSAVRLQNGDRKGSFEKRKEFNDGWSQSSVHFLACGSSKCCFAGHINVDIIWTKAITVEKQGLKLRWTFLAKSHVPQTKVTGRQYQFQCLFCTFVSGQSASYRGTDAYLDHISREHRGEAFSEVVLHKCAAVTDRVCEDKEDFDINLWPLNTANSDSNYARKASGWSEFGLIRTSSNQSGRSNPDSVLAASPQEEEEEPWNAGLSNFHMNDDYIKSDDFD